MTHQTFLGEYKCAVNEMHVVLIKVQSDILAVGAIKALAIEIQTRVKTTRKEHVLHHGQRLGLFLLLLFCFVCYSYGPAIADGRAL